MDWLHSGNVAVPPTQPSVITRDNVQSFGNGLTRARLRRPPLVFVDFGLQKLANAAAIKEPLAALLIAAC